VSRWTASVTVAIAVLAAGCASDNDSQPAQQPVTTTAPPPTQTITNLPAPVTATRQVLLDAATAGHYDALRGLINRELFLSDYGFGDSAPDPIPRWQTQGRKPLEIMAALLQMPHAVQETNEGTLYQWPRFTADSTLAEVSQPERDTFLTFMSKRRLARVFDAEYGYTGPRLGILANGAWWFFLMNPDP
jgi:hypothetical protein